MRPRTSPININDIEVSFYREEERGPIDPFEKVQSFDEAAERLGEKDYQRALHRLPRWKDWPSDKAKYVIIARRARRSAKDMKTPVAKLLRVGYQISVMRLDTGKVQVLNKSVILRVPMKLATETAKAAASFQAAAAVIASGVPVTGTMQDLGDKFAFVFPKSELKALLKH